MRALALLWPAACCAAGLLAATPDEAPAAALLALQATARRHLDAELAARPRGGCTRDTLQIRTEWRALPPAARRRYIDAVYCLQRKPGLIDQRQVPGAKSLFDSFTTLHINQTHTIHNNFSFLVWHRYFVHVYEQALRDCGYTGNHPYWEWGYDVYDPANAPILDGSPLSLGSDGAPLAGRNATWAQWPPPPFAPTPDLVVEFPRGTGGGCVQRGPFADMTVHFGPISQADQRHLHRMFAFRPHCLQRDLNPAIGQRYLAFNWSVWAVAESADIMGFQARITGDRRQGHGAYPLNRFGAHGGGHFFAGGMTGAFSDLYASPQDPLFFPHHAQIDRLWAIWQWLDIAARRHALFGSLTYENLPPARNGSLDDAIDLAPLAAPVAVRELMDVVAGPYCYFYE
ncbi:hypothetical protein LOZ67_005959 [Ophidiomyces ophidiicola]|nr:hypothetical protein LOZ60_005850 [Ophidiomyces ophidiicola]KAI2145632.1 hypothetical protein LOZ27_003259 [Ophidiomyces ophidiicola]KAI2396195.1 hypothetical protein LOZ67_005959 [Ophidiomyces ophidiicola]